MTGHQRMDSFPVNGWRSANGCGPDGGNCVEVNLDGVDDGAGGCDDLGVDIIGVRDSKSATGSALAFRPAQWQSFLSATIMDNIGD